MHPPRRNLQSSNESCISHQALSNLIPVKTKRPISTEEQALSNNQPELGTENRLSLTKMDLNSCFHQFSQTTHRVQEKYPETLDPHRAISIQCSRTAANFKQWTNFQKYMVFFPALRKNLPLTNNGKMPKT